jgi:hypothetical protein
MATHAHWFVPSAGFRTFTDCSFAPQVRPVQSDKDDRRSQMTVAAVQYVPSTLPDCPISQRGSAAFVQSLLATASVHGVVHAAYCPPET